MMKTLLNKRVLIILALAKKHKTDKKHIEKELKRGIRVEHEHTTKLAVARRIALAHLGKDPNYYEKLKKIEKKNLNENSRKRTRDRFSELFTHKIEGNYYPDLNNRLNRDADLRLKRVFNMRETHSDAMIAQRYSSLYDKSFRTDAVTNFFESNINHKHYKKSNFLKYSEIGEKKSNVSPSDSLKRSMVGLSMLGHSASNVAYFLTKPDNKITKNIVIGTLYRMPESNKYKIHSELKDGINVPSEYNEHKDKPVIRPVNKKEKQFSMKESRINNIFSIIRESASFGKKDQEDIIRNLLVKQLNDLVTRTGYGDPKLESEMHPSVLFKVMQHVKHTNSMINGLGPKKRRPKK